jgi:hypothetical protein
VHPFVKVHRFPLRAGGLVGDGEGIGHRVQREPVRIQFPIELENSDDETRSRSGGRQGCRLPAAGRLREVAGAIERMEAGVAQTGRRVPNVV